MGEAAVTDELDPRFVAAFGELSAEDQERARDAVDRVASGIGDLIPLMHGNDQGGATRVGYMLVTLGRKLAGVA